MKNLLSINPKTESKRIINFIKKTFKQQRIHTAIIGLSGGIDSALTLTLLSKALKPKQIIVLYMPYEIPLIQSKNKNLKQIKKLVKKLHIPKNNFLIIPIKKPVNKFIDIITTANMTIWQKFIFGARECFTCPNISDNTRIRAGNLLVRSRMVILYDLAKKYHGMVVGTENKSEHLLGYFTQHGDAASDIEPIIRLYKTQVYELAKYLKIDKEIINKPASADLWDNQTDESELGFTYKEADSVMHLYYKKKIKLEKIKNMGYKNAYKIIKRIKNNQFKQITPYIIDNRN